MRFFYVIIIICLHIYVNTNKEDCCIPGAVNLDHADIARTAKISSSGYIDGYCPENVVSGVTRSVEDNSHLWQSKDMCEENVFLKFEFHEAKKIIDNNERLCIIKTDSPVTADMVLIEIESTYGDKTAKYLK